MVSKFGFDAAVSVLSLIMALLLFLIGAMSHFDYSVGLLFPSLFVSYAFFYGNAFWAIVSVLLLLVFLGLAFIFASEGVKNTRTTEGLFLSEAIKLTSLSFLILIGFDLMFLMLRLPRLLM